MTKRERLKVAEVIKTYRAIFDALHESTKPHSCFMVGSRCAYEDHSKQAAQAIKLLSR